MLHLYRIYQLEKVIHENLRPEKSQEVQKVGGKRKSYKLDPDNGEASEDGKIVTKKPRRKRAKKEAIKSTELLAGEGMNIGGDLLPERGRETILQTPGTGGVTKEQKSEEVPARRFEKKEPVVDMEAGDQAKTPKVSWKGKQSNGSGTRGRKEAKSSQTRREEKGS